MSALALLHLGGSLLEVPRLRVKSLVSAALLPKAPAFRRVSPLPQAAEDFQDGRRFARGSS